MVNTTSDVLQQNLLECHQVIQVLQVYSGSLEMNVFIFGEIINMLFRDCKALNSSREALEASNTKPVESLDVVGGVQLC